MGVFQRVSTFSILRCEIHFKSGLEIDQSQQYALSLLSPSPLSCLYLLHLDFSLFCSFYFFVGSFVCFHPLIQRFIISPFFVVYHLEKLWQALFGWHKSHFHEGSPAGKFQHFNHWRKKKRKSSRNKDEMRNKWDQMMRWQVIIQCRCLIWNQ